MKKLFAAVVLLSVVLWSFPCHAQWQLTTINDSLAYSATNTIHADVSDTSAIAVGVAFAGSGAHTTTGVIGVTALDSVTNGQTLTVVSDGASTIYHWTNTPQLTATTLSVPYTNLVFTVTNSVNATNGTTMTVVPN